MIVSEENQRLYLSTWSYNASRILTELAKIVKDNNGRVKPLHTAIITDHNSGSVYEPIKVTHTSYIKFILDGFIYYYEINDNAFFDFYFNKLPIKNNKYPRNSYCLCDSKEWVYDWFFKTNCDEAKITEAAKHVFSMLIMSDVSNYYTEYEKIDVPNLYNNGHHKEIIVKSYLNEIDF